MNISASECSSGCESGWTAYLDQLSNSTADTYFYHGGKGARAADEDDEDLSMVSDASSAPPNFHGQKEYDAVEDRDRSKHSSKSKGTRMMKNQQQHTLCLDDTATSPILHFYQGNVAPPECRDHAPANVPGSSTGESIPKKKLSFFKSSTKGKSGSLKGRKKH